MNHIYRMEMVTITTSFYLLVSPLRKGKEAVRRLIRGLNFGVSVPGYDRLIYRWPFNLDSL